MRFRPLSAAEVAAYVRTGECDDKAGAYAAQGAGMLLIDRVEGSFSKRGGPSDDPRRGDAFPGAADPGHAQRHGMVRLRGWGAMSPPGSPPGEGAPLGERAAWVRDRIADAARRSGRPAGSVKLVAVSKTRPLARILEAHAAGLSVFGENYVQEAEGKIPGLPGAEWHLIGRLQGNKVRRAVALFSWIQTADSARRLREISRCAADSGKTARVLIEVNLVGEGSKAGADPGDLRAILDEFRRTPRGAGGGVHGDPAVLRRPRGEPAPLRAAAGTAGRAGAGASRRGARGAVDGDVQRFRTGDRRRGDDGPRRDRDLR